MVRLLRFAALAAALVAVAAPAAAEKPPVFADRGMALRGTDPVAYFTQGKPVRGSAQFALRWNGATWHFASAANRDAFKADPAKYAPQYGGYCAYAVSRGYTAPVDPEAWTIVAGKLYLNYSKSVQRRWQSDIPGNVKAADGHWPSVLKK